MCGFPSCEGIKSGNEFSFQNQMHLRSEIGYTVGLLHDAIRLGKKRDAFSLRVKLKELINGPDIGLQLKPEQPHPNPPEELYEDWLKKARSGIA